MAVCADWGRSSAVLAVLLVSTACGAQPEQPKPEPAPIPVDVAIGGKRLNGGQHLQSAAEASITRALAQQKVARSGDGSVHCWFAKVDPNVQAQGGRAVDVTDTLWCGPVQVPGTGPAPDWIPVPLAQRDGQFSVGEPKLPEPGTSSTPSTEMVRVDGTVAKPGGEEQRSAGPGFFAVVADNGGRSNGDLGLIPADAVHLRDDFLTVRATGWGNPQRFTLPDGGVLSPESGSRLAVLRLHSDRVSQLEQELTDLSWTRGAPPRPELALDLPDGWHDVPDSQLPQFGSFFLVFTVPVKDTGQAAPRLVLRSKTGPGLEQQVELPTGKAAYPLPPALRRASGAAAQLTASQALTFQHAGSSGTAKLTVQGVRLGMQRPVLDSAGRLDLESAAPGKALLEIRLKGEGGLPEALGGPSTAEHIQVKLPSGAKAPLKGVRYGGDVFPTALVVEVPSNVPSVTVSLAPATVTLPSRGPFTFAPAAPAMTLPLNF